MLSGTRVDSLLETSFETLFATQNPCRGSMPSNETHAGFDVRCETPCNRAQNEEEFQRGGSGFLHISSADESVVRSRQSNVSTESHIMCIPLILPPFSSDPPLTRGEGGVIIQLYQLIPTANPDAHTTKKH